jgi:phage terminase large subunit GpA-like protein
MVLILHTALCAHCHQPITEQDWGDGGRIWIHTGTVRTYCSLDRATPDPETLTAHEVHAE